MFAVIKMNPPMDQAQWLLITLTAGVGGSLLSVGSAAGVALMGASRGQYTFMSHLRWTLGDRAGLHRQHRAAPVAGSARVRALTAAASRSAPGM